MGMQGSDEHIMLVPGMYSPRLIMQPLAARLRREGFKTRIFNNRFLTRSPKVNSERLLSELQSMPGSVVHLLGHSLGGIVILHALDANAKLPTSEQFAVGRVVLLASPVRGSDLARRLHARRWTRPLLGKSAEGGVLENAPTELNGRETGVISGSSRAGLSALIFRPAQVNDGVVNQSETELDGAADSLCLPQSHALMLFSSLTAHKAAQFLMHGRFVD